MCCGGGVSLTFFSGKALFVNFFVLLRYSDSPPNAPPLSVNYYASIKSSFSSGFSSAVTDKAHRVHHNYLVFNKDFMKGVSE